MHANTHKLQKSMIVLLTGALLLSITQRPVRADFALGTPTNLRWPVTNSDIEGSPSISADGLSLYFSRIRSGSADIYVTQRASVSDPWGEAVNLGPAVNSSSYDGEPGISSDGLSLYFGSKRPGGYGKADIWVATRASTSDPWEKAVNLGPTINTEADDIDVCISADGLSLYFDSFREGGHGSIDLWVATRETPSDPWQEPVNLGTAVNGLSGDSAPSISADGKVLFFSDFFDPRPGGQGNADIWMTMRATVSDPWGEPVNLGPAINTSAHDAHPDISADGSTLYFTSTRPRTAGFSPLWQVSIDPVVDFTGDYRVDIEDLLILIEHWGQNEPAYDMGPMPWGDGVVDAADLEVLMSYWGQEIYDPNLRALWKLDEAEGDVAYDSAREYDAIVVGNVLWQPEAGQLDGALQLDGVDDYVSAPFVLDPTKQPFSAFAWVKGGQPGQTIISQQGGFGSWLSVDSAGALATGLTFPMPAVTSDVVITDDNWYRVGLVSDGVGMSLYVDDVEVARTPTSPILPATGDLQIGAGTNLETGSFWFGLIDDVRVYDRVEVP